MCPHLPPAPSPPCRAAPCRASPHQAPAAHSRRCNDSLWPETGEQHQLSLLPRTPLMGKGWLFRVFHNCGGRCSASAEQSRAEQRRVATKRSLSSMSLAVFLWPARPRTGGVPSCPARGWLQRGQRVQHAAPCTSSSAFHGREKRGGRQEAEARRVDDAKRRVIRAASPADYPPNRRRRHPLSTEFFFGAAPSKQARARLLLAKNTQRKRWWKAAEGGGADPLKSLSLAVLPA